MSQALTEAEGVRKFDLDHQNGSFHIPGSSLVRLNAVRAQLCRLGLIGQDKARYEGAGFGNLSMRVADHPDNFVITGSQTGRLTALACPDLALVTGVDVQASRLTSLGKTLPSSEAMSHAVFYRAFADVQAVIHVHSPLIWQKAAALGLAATARHIAYGTPAMAMAIVQKAKDLRARKQALLLVMGGHEDGVIAAADSLEQCSRVLTDALAQATLA
ncbi:MAG: aldolase [Oleiphilus sp.]|nr:MAG: aldolase [Oleiphilus sp.]